MAHPFLALGTYMFIINLVRSATDKFAPKTEHPRLVVGGILVAFSLVILSIIWSVLPWGGLINLAVTFLIAVAFVAGTETIHRSVMRQRAKKAELEKADQNQQPTLVESTQVLQEDIEESKPEELRDPVNPDDPTITMDTAQAPRRQFPPYDPEKWPQYSDYLATLDPQDRHDLWITEQLVQSHQDAAYADALEDEDDTIHWKKRPHVKYFWKRTWWRALIVIPAEFIVVYFGIKAIGNFNLPTWLFLVPLLALLWGVWYGYRRWYKWHELYLVIQGSWLIIQKAKNPWLGLYGKNANSPRVPLISCNNIIPSESFWESIKLPPWKKDGRPLFKSGRIDINTSIPDRGDGGGNDAYDDFRYLTDVRDHFGFAARVEQMHDRLIAGRPTIIRSLQGNS